MSTKIALKILTNIDIYLSNTVGEFQNAKERMEKRKKENPAMRKSLQKESNYFQRP